MGTILLSGPRTGVTGQVAREARGAAWPSRKRQEGRCELHAEALLWALAWDVLRERSNCVPCLNTHVV